MALVVAIAAAGTAARPVVANGAPTPTTVSLEITPNPTPTGEWATLRAKVEPNPGHSRAIEYEWRDEEGNSWSSMSLTNALGEDQRPILVGEGTYDITATFHGAPDFAPSVSDTYSYAVLPRIIATPRLRIDTPAIYVQQTVDFTTWASPVPLSGSLRVSGGTYLRSGEFPPADGPSQGTLDLGHGRYEIWAELIGGSTAQGCPIVIEPQLRPSQPVLEVADGEIRIGQPARFSMSVFDPGALPSFNGGMTADLHVRHENGRETVRQDIDISSGGATATVPITAAGKVRAWFTLAEHIWSDARSNEVQIQVGPPDRSSFPPLPQAQPGAMPTTITLDDLPDTAWKQEELPFRITIDPAPTTGRVLVQDGPAIALASPTSTPGIYTVTGWQLSAGAHNFRAVYEGSDGFAPSASEPQAVFADSIPTTTTLTFTPANPDGLTQVTVTAKVEPIPSGGTVYLYRDGVYHGSKRVDTTTGLASWTDTWPLWGTPNPTTALFEFGGRYADSHSDEIHINVEPRSTTVTISGPNDVAHADEAVRYTFDYSPVPEGSGTLRVHVDGELWKSRYASGGRAIVPVPLSPGRHTLQAEYVDMYSSGWSEVLAVEVGPYSNRLPIRGTVEVNGGSQYANSPLVLAEATLDADSAPARVFQLSNDGLNWATFPYEAGGNNAVLWDTSAAECGGTTGTGEHRVYYRWSNYGDWDNAPVESVSVTITDGSDSGVTLDFQAPSAATPAVAAATSSTNALGEPSGAVVEWSGSDDLSGVASYDLEQAVDGGAWQRVDRADAAASRERLTLAEGSSYQFRVRARDRAGNLGAWSAPSAPFVAPADVTAPEVTAPSAGLLGDRRLSGTPTVRIAWSPAADATGLARYRLEKRTNSRRWTDVTLPSSLATAVELALPSGTSTYQFRLSATDVAGNTSAPASANPLRVLKVEESSAAITFSRGWRRMALAGSSAGYVKRATIAGAGATYVFSGSSVAVAMTTGPNRGIAQITLDGVSQEIDLYSASQRTAWLAFAATVAPGSHTLRIEVLGRKNVQSSGTRVDLDAILTLR